MGARRELVTGMLLGVVVGVAITVAVFQLRGEADISAAPNAAEAHAAQVAQREREELVRDRASQQGSAGALGRHGRLPASPERAAAAPEPGPDRGMSTSDAWWATLPPDPAWDAPRRAKVLERLARLGVQLAAEQVECKRRCCRIALSDDLYAEHFTDIRSSVGLDFEAPDGIGVANAGSTYMVTKCWRPGDPPMPDRLAEREALLAKARPEVERCARGTSPAITLELLLHVDDAGRIFRVDSNAKQLGQKVASCAETAVLQAAAFAPWPRDSEVPVTIVLGN